MADSQVNGRVVTIALRRTSPSVYRNLPRCYLGLAIFQMICGAALLIAGISSIVTRSSSFGVVGVGCSVWVILAGSFGIAAGIQKTICEIVSSMIFSILAGINSICVAVLMGSALYAIIVVGENNNRYGAPAEGDTLNGNSSTNNQMAVCIALVIFSVAEAFASIAMSAVGCQFSCFCCRNCCCKFDTTTIEKGIIYEDQEEQLLQPVAHTATPTAYVITSQQQTAYQPTVPAAYAVGGVTGNNTWLQNKYTRLDDDLLAA